MPITTFPSSSDCFIVSYIAVYFFNSPENWFLVPLCARFEREKKFILQTGGTSDAVIIWQINLTVCLENISKIDAILDIYELLALELLRRIKLGLRTNRLHSPLNRPRSYVRISNGNFQRLDL